MRSGGTPAAPRAFGQARWRLLSAVVLAKVLLALRVRPAWQSLSALLLVLATAAGTAPAQAPDELEEAVFFPADRSSLHRLSNARELIAAGRYDEAVRLLDALIAGPEDFFFQPDKATATYRSLKSEAQRLIGQLPPKGRASYELQFGAQAQNLLDRAARDADPEQLADVARRFFHTRAGYEAVELLGTYEMEHGRPLAAALCFKRLQQAPAAAEMFEPLLSAKIAVCWLRAAMPGPARQALAGLKQRLPPGGRVTVAGEARELYRTEAESMAWLAELAGPSAGAPGKLAEDWLMYRGSANRNAASTGGTPLLNRRWAVPTVAEPQLDQSIDQLRQAYVDQGQTILPGGQPLAVKDLVITRSLAGLLAVDFRTGRRVWKGASDEFVDQVLDGSLPERDQASLNTWLEQRVFEDLNYGELSSDGEHVFCIEDLAAKLPSEHNRTVFLPGGRLRTPDALRASNRLAAYELATEGRLRWELPERMTGQQPAGELADAFFLGAPLPLAEHLYVLAEIKGEIRLVAITARSGEVVWSQQLAVLEQTIAEDSARRAAGVSPSYSEGVLVCPTAAGAVVAVDLTSRSLLWGYQYRSSQPPVRPRFRGWGRFNATTDNRTSEHDRWLDASATIAEGRVLLTPREGLDEDHLRSELHCLDLLEGRLLWKKPREDGLYIGCVEHGRVLVVGRNSLRCYKLSDGSSAWTEVTLALPAGSIPSGRGFYHGSRYYLPLSSAEVMAIDVEQGKIVGRSKSRGGIVPGNLICHHGTVLSQGATQLECFYELEDLRRQVAAALHANPDDSEALARRGELLLNEGKLDDAVAVLRRSFKLKPAARTRSLLVDSLLEGLRIDFAAHRGQQAELEQLIDEPGERLDYLRRLAIGLEQTGEPLEALETYFKIIELPTTGKLDRVDATLLARRDRWVQASLKTLWQSASDRDRPALDRATQERLDRAIAGGPAKLHDFINYFGSHPLAEVAREKLVFALPADAPLIERELLERRLEQSASPQRARAAASRLAKMFVDAGRAQDAATWIAKLAGPWAELECSGGKTGRQIADELRQGGQVAALDPHADPWPTGLVRKDLLQGSSGPSYRSFPVDLRVSQGDVFAGTGLEFDQPRSTLVGRDRLGREAWRVGLADKSERAQYGYNPTFMHARTDGHVMVLSVGFQIIGIDTLGTPGVDGPRVLWRHDLSDGLPTRGGQIGGIRAHQINVPGGQHRFAAVDAYNRPIGTTGPLEPGFACFQRQRSVVAVDPLTGEVLWTRSGIQPGSDLFGDDERLFVTPRGASEAIVLGALDGQEVGRRAVPQPEQRLAVLGSRVLTWSNSALGPLLELRDIWTEKTLWQKQFEPRAAPWTVDAETVAVYEGRGRFWLFNVVDGKPLIDAAMPAEPELQAAYVYRTPSRVLVVVNRNWINRSGENVQPVPGGFGSPMIHGLMHGFDAASGKLLYSTPVDNRALAFNQPADLPVQVFASQAFKQSGAETITRVSMLCVDKRTGRVVYDEQTPGPITSIELSGEPHERQVTLKTIRGAVRLTFTDDAWPPPGTKPPPTGSLPERAGRTLFRGMQKWIDAFAPRPESFGRFPPGP